MDGICLGGREEVDRFTIVWIDNCEEKAHVVDLTSGILHDSEIIIGTCGL